MEYGVLYGVYRDGLFCAAATHTCGAETGVSSSEHPSPLSKEKNTTLEHLPS